MWGPAQKKKKISGICRNANDSLQIPAAGILAPNIRLSMLSIDCVAQQYAWGIKGNASLVAKCKKSSNDTFKIEPEECYAELW